MQLTAQVYKEMRRGTLRWTTQYLQSKTLIMVRSKLLDSQNAWSVATAHENNMGFQGHE